MIIVRNIYIKSIYIIITEGRRPNKCYDDKKFNSEVVRNWYLKGNHTTNDKIENTSFSSNNVFVRTNRINDDPSVLYQEPILDAIV